MNAEKLKIRLARDAVALLKLEGMDKVHFKADCENGVLMVWIATQSAFAQMQAERGRRGG